MLFSRLKHFQKRFVIFDTQGLPPSCAVVLLSKASCDHRVLLHFCLKAVMLADEWCRPRCWLGYTAAISYAKLRTWSLSSKVPIHFSSQEF